MVLAMVPAPVASSAHTDGSPGAGGSAAAFTPRSMQVGGRRRDYQVFIPRGPLDAAPVILYLHGSGERGNDNQLQLWAGLAPRLRAHAADFPAIAVFPQAPWDSWWSGEAARAAVTALDQTLAEVGGDRRRVYLTGISRGGYGAWELALEEPDRFAALVPICGGILPPAGRTDLGVTVLDRLVEGGADPYAVVASRLRHIPTWIFHGADDDRIAPEGSRRLAAALRAAGGDVRYTELPGTGHNAWDPAYGDPALWTWLFAQRREEAPRP